MPIGYSTSHFSYDTTAIAGRALTDPDFNHDAGGVGGNGCLLYTSDAADEGSSGDLGGRRIIKKKKHLQRSGVYRLYRKQRKVED